MAPANQDLLLRRGGVISAKNDSEMNKKLRHLPLFAFEKESERLRLRCSHCGFKLIAAAIKQGHFGGSTDLLVQEAALEEAGRAVRSKFAEVIAWRETRAWRSARAPAE